METFQDLTSNKVSSMGARATFPGANNTSTASTKLSPAQTLPVMAKANTQPSNMSGDFMKAPTSTAFTSQVAGVPNKPSINVKPPSTDNVTKHSVTTGADGSTTVTHNYTTPKVADTSSTANPVKPINNAGVTGSYTNPTNQNQQSQSIERDQNQPKPASNPADYSSSVSSLANQQNSPYNQGAQNNIGLLQQITGQNQTYSDRAKAIADAAGQRISDIGQAGAKGEAGYLTTGTSPVAEGNAAIFAKTTTAKQGAVSEGANMQLSGNAQGLTAQQQAQSGYNNAAGQNLTGQGLAQGAISSAAGYSKPELGSYGQNYYNPLNPNQGGGGVPATNSDGTPNPMYTALQNYAQMAANGQISSIPSSITSNPVLNNQLNTMAKQINPAYNPIVSAAQGAATSSNVQTGGTAQTNAAASAYQNSYPAVVQLNTALNNVDSAGKMTVENAQGNGVNPFALAPANTKLSQLKTHLSDNGQVTFNSNMANLKAAIQNIYAANGGATPTGIEATIGQMADGSLSISGLNALITAAKAEGQSRLDNAKNTASSEFLKTQGGNTTSSGNTSANPWH